MMKKTILLTVCAMVLAGNIAVAQGTPAVIQEISRTVVSETDPGFTKLTMKYPEVRIPDNETASQKISYYYANDAEKAEQHFRKEIKKFKKAEGLSYKVTLNDGKYLSIRDRIYVYYYRAAHPVSSDVGSTFDMTTGKILRWQDVIRPTDATAFTLAAINAKIFASKYNQMHAFFNSFKGLKKLPTNYYLDNQRNIHFLFGQYEIGPYSSGIIDINMEKQAK